MTGVPCIILSACSRNSSAVQMATRGQSHQLVHMTVCRGPVALLSLLWPVHGRTTWVPEAGSTEAFAQVTVARSRLLSAVSTFPARAGGRESQTEPGLGFAVWARLRGSKKPLPPGDWATVQVEGEAQR